MTYVPATARELLTLVGFSGTALDTALGVARAESAGYVDAVGDYGITDAKWGPSVGLFQVRTLVDPTAFSVADRVRDIEKLRDPIYQAYAARILSNGGTNWQPWSVFTSGSYAGFVGQDFPLKSGHAQADRWNLRGYSIRDIDPLKARIADLESQLAPLEAERNALAERNVVLTAAIADARTALDSVE